MTARKEITISKTPPGLEITEAFGDVERMFEDMLSGRWLQPFAWQRPFAAMPQAPSIDVIDHEDEVIVRAEVPGYKKDEIEISLADGAVTIKGETKAEKKEQRRDYYRCEISRGSFARTVGLPAAVDQSKASASMHDGVLELTLPKLEKSKRQTISIS